MDLILGRIEQPEEQAKDKKMTSPSIGFWQLLALNKPEWYFVVTGVLSAGVVGATHPTLAIVFSRMLQVCPSVSFSVSLSVKGILIINKLAEVQKTVLMPSISMLAHTKIFYRCCIHVAVVAFKMKLRITSLTFAWLLSGHCFKAFHLFLWSTTNLDVPRNS